MTEPGRTGVDDRVAAPVDAAWRLPSAVGGPGRPVRFVLSPATPARAPTGAPASASTSVLIPAPVSSVRHPGCTVPAIHRSVASLIW